MSDTNYQMLEQAIRDYLQWIKSREYRNRKGRKRYEKVLSDFLAFVSEKKISWDDMFTLDSLKGFRKYTTLPNPSHALRGLCGYLYSNGRISQPLGISNYQVDLPEVYEQYLAYHEQAKQTPYNQVKQVRRVLASFYDYLARHKIELSHLQVEHIDAFFAEFNKLFAQSTCKTYRFFLRGFLSYLYHECRILPENLAPVVVGAPMFAQANPPKFLRPQEVQKLFASLKLSTPVEIRTYTMVHLAYTLGLRPKEISLITLDDISFSKRQLDLRIRKNDNPITLPIPEQTIKAVVLYVTRARPKSRRRHLFLSFQRPHRPISSGTVIGYISKAMKQAGLQSSAYWLRHTYAQNLLQIGISIYEIKEMLGHQNIQSTKRYLHIHTELMRGVLFDETL
ncbi:MAG: tyrosine-type recombinase/integrase [Deltaproteobacteria bacterium]|nr:tyrosine-type recombinase/integrase [Deltaproteobacteria bacterium]